MKVSLRASSQSTSWISELPWVMLGLRTMLKDNLGTSPVNLVFGSLLTIPGEFVGHDQGEPVPELLCRLRDNVADLRPVPPVHHASPTTSPPTSLFSAKFIFIHHDGHKLPLQSRYDGPFRVLAPGDKFFRVQIGNREETISIDRLKIAMLISLLRSKWRSHHNVVALHTLPHSPLFYHLKSNQVPQSQDLHALDKSSGHQHSFCTEITIYDTVNYNQVSSGGNCVAAQVTHRNLDIIYLTLPYG